MMVRVGITEYRKSTGDPNGNTVNGTISGTTLTGNATTFQAGGATRLVDKKIIIEGIGTFKVGSVASDTSLTIIGDTFPSSFTDKLWFEDVSEALIAPAELTKKVESENPGEAGIVVFDEAEFSFYYDILGSSGYVYEATESIDHFFNTTLDSKKRYYIVVSLIEDYQADPADDYNYYHGIVDFNSLEFPAYKETGGLLQNIVNFSTLDKISSLGMLDNTPRQRGNWKDIFTRIAGHSYGGASMTGSWKYSYMRSIETGVITGFGHQNPFKEKIAILASINSDGWSYIDHSTQGTQKSVTSVVYEDATHVRVNCTGHGFSQGNIINIFGTSAGGTPLVGINRSNLVITSTSTDYFICYFVGASSGESATGVYVF
jgi:hypothetical protein